MDHAPALSAAAPLEIRAHAAACPDCGAPSSGLPAVRTALLGGIPLKRCFRCGRRASCEPVPRRVVLCGRCHLPFFEEDPALEHCVTCRDGGPAPDPALAAAAEAEVRAEVGQSWECVATPELSSYLHHVVARVASRIPGAPAAGDVVLVREQAQRTLALPSGTVLLTTGSLMALENEAELAFLLGHEIAHLVAGDSARALAAIGLRELAAFQGEPGGLPWVHAALDLMRLGHGDRAEHDADALAHDALLAAGYDQTAASTYLRRLSASAGAGQPEVADLAAAHPPPGDRLKRIEARGNRRIGASVAGRLDREVFRRAAGHSVLAARVARVEPFAPAGAAVAAAGTGQSTRRAWLALGLGVGLGLVALAVWALL